MKKLLFGCAAAIVFVGSLVGAAFGQTVAPKATYLHLNDLVQVVPYGAGVAQSVYANPGAIAAIEQYSYQVPLTAWTITPANGTSLLYLNPAGTLATGTLTMQALPSDGQKFCIESSQTQTAMTVSANTNQAMASFGGAALTAMTANTKYCWFFDAALAVWVRTQ